MADVQKVTVSRLDAGTAAKMLQGVERFDPRGTATAADVLAMASQGHCFAATVGDAQCVYVLNVHNGQAWINAAKGQGAADLTGLVLPAVELQASQLKSVAFQTARPGLVRKAKRLGYRVTGWIMKKDIRRETV